MTRKWLQQHQPDDNTLFGIQLGYEFYSMDYDIDNLRLNGIATIIGSVGYGYYSDYELEHFSITNSEITHYKGYTQLTGAIQDTDHVYPTTRWRRCFD